MTLCSLYGPLFPLQPSVPSTALCPLQDSLKNSKTTPIVSVKCSAKHQNPEVYRVLFHTSSNRNYRSCIILSDNREIAIIASVKKIAIIFENQIQQEAIIEFCKN